MANTNLTTVLLIVLSVDLILFLGQVSIHNINPEAPTYLNYPGSFLGRFDIGNYTLDQDIMEGNKLPSLEQSVSVTTGNIFTDSITSIKNWLLDTSGLGYVLGVLGGPITYLGYLGAPKEFIFAIGALWYGITLFLIIGFIFGRNT